MTFQRIELRHFERFREVLKNNNFLTILGSEYCFTVMFAHRDYLDIEFCDNGYALIIRGKRKGRMFFAPPVCAVAGDFIRACGDIKSYCKNTGNEMKMLCITEEMYELIKDEPGYSFKDVRDYYEYIYDYSDMAELKGKKFHSKRNFVNVFEKTYQFELRKYQPSDLRQIEALIEIWESSKNSYSEYEKNAIINTLENIEQLKAVCNVIVIDGGIRSFIIASKDCKQDANILFAKADINYKGIYTAMLKYTVANDLAGCRYINMQEDMGIEGLRKSKLSYNPYMLLRKFNVTGND